jgi:rhodanese-related sulfurtransferase
MTNLDPQESYEFLQQNPESLWIDCRSEPEYYLVGHPIVEREGADPRRPEQIVWVDELTAELNPDFVAQVRQFATGPDQPVVVCCRSGRRSVQAAEALEAEGFKHVINVLEGFEGPLDDSYRRGTVSGWRFRGLPWEQL